MPYHEYKCRICGQYFQRRVASSDEPVACLKCGARDLEVMSGRPEDSGLCGAVRGAAAAGGRSKY